jgi:hypothetical protein
VAALALGDEQRSLSYLDVSETQTEHLAPTKPAQRHGEDHGPVAMSA